MVKVFYATDRNHVLQVSPIEQYGGDRSDREALALGVSEVSIPRDHRIGMLESPSIWHLEFRNDPEKHVVLLSARQQSYEDFYHQLSNSVLESGGKSVLVFVHGYNVTFEDALRRTAQISYDLAYDGVPVSYSWPSKGDISGYTADEASVEWSVPHLQYFLEDLAAKSGAKSIDLVAHSMGNRALSRALQQIALTNHAPVQFNEVILAAPDIDRGVFLQLADAMRAVSRRITLYASENDKALRASMKLHAFPRAGEYAALVINPALDPIDASLVDTDFLGHSYFGDNRSVISDMYDLLRTGNPPDQRFGIKKMKATSGFYFRFAP